MDALIFIDTNVYLDFYRLRKGDISMDYLERLENINDRIISTCQVQMEFLKNRQKVITESIAEGIDKKTSQNYQVPSFFTSNETLQEIQRVKKILKKLEKELKKDIEKVLLNPKKEDRVYKSLLNLFSEDSEYHLEFDSEEFEEIRNNALKRWRAGYPPRKDKDTSIGDAINWEWMIKCIQKSKKDLIIVTRDEDFGPRYKKKGLHLNDWLNKEFHDRIDGKTNIVLTNSLSNALEAIDVDVTKEMKDEESDLLETLTIYQISKDHNRISDSLRDILGPAYEKDEKNMGAFSFDILSPPFTDIFSTSFIESMNLQLEDSEEE